MQGTQALVHIGDVPFGGDSRFSIIAGPCVIEGRDHALRHAEAVTSICRRIGVPVVYKSSFDKANRTSIGSFRGVEIEEGLAILAAVRDALGLVVARLAGGDAARPPRAKLVPGSYRARLVGPDGRALGAAEFALVDRPLVVVLP